MRTYVRILFTYTISGILTGKYFHHPLSKGRELKSTFRHFSHSRFFRLFIWTKKKYIYLYRILRTYFINRKKHVKISSYDLRNETITELIFLVRLHYFRVRLCSEFS